MNVPKDNEIEENVAKVSNPCVIELDLDQTSIPNVMRSRSSSSSCQDIFLPNTNGIHLSGIPKHITSFDEKYVLHCLELLRNYALRAAASNFASKAQIPPDDWTYLAQTKIIGQHDMGAKQGIHTGSQSIINILNRPLTQNFGSTDFGVNIRVKHLLEPVYSHLPYSLREPSNSSMPENKVTVINPKKSSAYPPDHKRAMSISSMNANYSEKSSFQGMLHCKWKDGMPFFVFSVNGKTEVYTASLSKDDKDFEYIYTFSSRMKGKKELMCEELEPHILCTMKVWTSSSSEVKETRFVLSLSGEGHCTDDLQFSNHNRKKNQRLVSKVAKVFRSSHSCKQRPSSSIFEEMRSENDCLQQNIEMAAIIVKDRILKNSIGGWGLKFLKKSGKDVCLKTFSPSEGMGSLDVLIPVGFHGGGRMGGDNGPSSLVERWASGGVCDCGGWDLGCPLTVLSVGPTGANSSYLVDSLGDCKSVDLFKQGSKQDVPIFKMSNIHEGLYCVHFQSTLSTLQSFAIAAAIIHARSPVHRSKV
ncbi:hypothetical protein STAS_29669 [Striga asiatica]|uniref:Uncharacterized protein n=1 Tax=Striga asiatica TaxID=4170 RepID=A0A5A7R372_STRAF|nr:hypothetical protein STAS_29669 [Striga asiatica]